MKIVTKLKHLLRSNTLHMSMNERGEIEIIVISDSTQSAHISTGRTMGQAAETAYKDTLKNIRCTKRQQRAAH